MNDACAFDNESRILISTGRHINALGRIESMRHAFQNTHRMALLLLLLESAIACRL